MTYDLSEYKGKLESMNLVHKNHIQYMVGWVKHFFMLGKPNNEEFTEMLSREGREDWQIRQALDSVKIYVGMYSENANTDKEKTGVVC